MSHKKIILIDGNSLLYRAFYALPTTLATSAGIITNAAYGFTSMLIKLLKDEKPDCIAVAFDAGLITFRHETFVDYKANRPQTPDELRHQFDLAKDILDALNISIFEKEGFEADDLLGTMAKQAEKTVNNVLIVTADKDAFQLISDKTKIMTTRKGITDIVIYNKEKLNERYGLPPNKMTDMVGLKGDPSDNIPGVPGIGDKTASKLIQEFGSLENVLTHLEKIKGEKLKGSLKEYADQAKQSKEIATLDLKVPIDFHIEKCGLDLDLKKIEPVFRDIEFNTLLERIREIVGEKRKEKGFQANLNKIEAAQLIKKLEKADTISLAAQLENKNLTELVVGIGGETFVVDDIKALKPFFEDKTKKKVTYEAKPIILALRFLDIKLTNVAFDAKISAYLLNPTRIEYPIEEMALKYLNLEVYPEEDTSQNLANQAYITAKLEQPLIELLKTENLKKIYQEIEMPLISVLAAMEYRGVGINTKELKTYSQELRQIISRLENDIYSLAGEDFNINSPQQLSQILFEKLRLKPIKKIKTGFSTDSTVLSKLINAHPIIEHIVNYRELNKLKSTYVDALPKLVDKKTGRLHTSFNQTVTATGRLSSSNPNLQNIPVRTDVGQRIRKSFVPANPTDLLMIADYSQIELRILAHLCQDKKLVEAFKKGLDIHSTTAAEVFGVPLEKVTTQMRRSAKAVNFGIVYGISARGLAQQLSISSDEAKVYIETYFARYEKVKEFSNKIIADAYKDGFVTTMFERKRPLPELKNPDIRIRNFGERSAVNSVLQGSAADIIKIVMIEAEKVLAKNGLLSRMILQVHDELIFEVPQLEQNVTASLIKEIMEKTVKIKPQLEVNISFGHNWLEAK